MNDHYPFISKINARTCGLISDHLWAMHGVQPLSAKQIKTIANDLFTFLVIRERTYKWAAEAR